jgi:hypothetical protein
LASLRSRIGPGIACRSTKAQGEVLIVYLFPQGTIELTAQASTPRQDREADVEDDSAKIGSLIGDR